MALREKIPYRNHARRHLPGGSDPIPAASGSSVYCTASLSADTIASATAVSAKTLLGSASATDTTAFSFDSTNGRVGIHVGGTYIVFCRVSGSPSVGHLLPTSILTFPFVTPLSTPDTAATSAVAYYDHMDIPTPYGAISQIPVFDSTHTLYTFSYAVVAPRDAENSPVFVQPWMICTADSTGTWTEGAKVQIWRAHDGNAADALTSL